LYRTRAIPSRETQISSLHNDLSFKNSQFTLKFTSKPYQALHISYHGSLLVSEWHWYQNGTGIRMALVSVGEKIALFKSSSPLACKGRLVVIYQRLLLFFCRRKVVGVFSGCKQEWDKIRRIITQGIIIEAVGFSDIPSRYQFCYENLLRKQPTRCNYVG